MYCNAPSGTISNRLVPSLSAIGPSTILPREAPSSNNEPSASAIRACFCSNVSPGLAFSNLRKTGCCLFDFRSSRQFKAVEFVAGDRPQITTLITERVLQQQRVLIEQLLLNFSQTKRLWLR